MSDNIMSPNEALKYLLSTDEEYAKAAAWAHFQEDQKKTTLAVLMANSPETSVSAARMHAEASPGYKQAVVNYRDAVLDRETMKAKRKSAEYAIELYRTESANRRKGNI